MSQSYDVYLTPHLAVNKILVVDTHPNLVPGRSVTALQQFTQLVVSVQSHRSCSLASRVFTTSPSTFFCQRDIFVQLVSCVGDCYSHTPTLHRAIKHLWCRAPYRNEMVKI